MKQWNCKIIYIIQILKINHYSKKKDAEEKTNGNNVGSQEQRRQLTSNENMISLMECYEIVGGLNK